MRKLLAAVSTLLIMAVAAIVPLHAQSVSDFGYCSDITVLNGTGATISDAPVRAGINTLNLIDAGYLNATATDMELFNLAGTSIIDMTAQDVLINNSSDWIHVNSLADGASESNSLCTGSTTFTTRDNGMGLYGTSEKVVITDAAAVDLTTDLGMDAENITFYTIPTAESHLISKFGAYELGVRSTNTVYARISSAASTTTAAGTPTAGGEGSSGVNLIESGCAGGSQQDCVDTSDGDTSYVYSNTASGYIDSYYTLSSTGLNAGTEIVSITGTARGRCVSAAASFNVKVGIKIGGSEAEQTINFSTTSYVTTTTANIAVPGGGSWSDKTIADLEGGEIKLSIDNTASCPTGGESRVTWVYLTITYYPVTEVTSATLAVDTEYDLAASYNGVTLQLSVDGTVVDSTASTITVNSNTQDIEIGTGWDGYVGTSVVRDGSTYIDSSANTNNGTPTAIFPVQGQLNGGGEYDGLTATLPVGSDASIDNIWDSGGTYECWVRVDGYTGGGERLADKTQWSVLPISSGGNVVWFSVAFGGGTGQWEIDNPGLGTLWHLAVTYDSGSASNDPLIYVDGASVTVTENSAPLGARTSDAGSTLYIGNNSGGNRTLDGLLDDCRLWDDIRTPAEIAASYASQLAGTETGLAAYWTFNNAASKLAYNPADLVQTQEGNGGNSWTWLGSADDTGEIGLTVGANDGAYTFVRDTTNVTVTVGPATAATTLTTTTSAEADPSLVSGDPDPGFANPYTEGTTAASFSWPLSIVANINTGVTNGYPLQLLAWSFALILGLGIAFLVYKKTRIIAWTIIASVAAVSLAVYMTPIADVIILLMIGTSVVTVFLIPRSWETR